MSRRNPASTDPSRGASGVARDAPSRYPAVPSRSAARAAVAMRRSDIRRVGAPGAKVMGPWCTSHGAVRLPIECTTAQPGRAAADRKPGWIEVGAMRRSLLLGLVGALILLIIGITAGFAGHTRALTRERNDLAHDAAEQAQVLNAYFARASSIILLTAHASDFRRFYAEPGDRDQRVRRGGGTPDPIN